MRESRRATDATLTPAGGADALPADREPDGSAIRAGLGRHALCPGVSATVSKALQASPLLTTTRTLQSIARGFSPFTAFPPRELPR